MITALLTAILPALWKLGSGALGNLFAYLTNAQNVGLAKEQAELSAETATNQAKVSLLTQFGPMLVSCTLGEICALFLGAIVLDSVFHFGWFVTVPAFLAKWFGVIVSSFVITAPFVGRSK